MKFKRFFNRVVFPLVGLLSLAVIIVFPFLSKVINHLFAVISFGCSLIIFSIIVLTSNKKNKKTDIATMVMVYYVFICIFVLEYFKTKFNWLWLIFGFVIIGIPCSLYFAIYWYKLKNKVTTLQEKKIRRNSLNYTLFYYVLDLFYMSFIVDSLICKYIFGGIVILHIFYNSTKAFINNIRPRILAIVHDVFIGLGITIYLIYIIPDNELRNVVTSIVSSVFGGYVTLLGVAWTIKDNSRNRKEDERKSKVPYLYIEKGEFASTFKSFEPILEETFEPFDSETRQCISINEFIVKNSNNSDCVLYGFILNGKFYKFDNIFLVERNTKFKVDIAHKKTLNSEQYEVNLSLIAKDVLDNYYKFDCELKLESNGDVLLENRHIPIDRYDVINLHLPIMIDIKSLEY